jgi:hypothetical protein
MMYSMIAFRSTQKDTWLVGVSFCGSKKEWCKEK